MHLPTKKSNLPDDKDHVNDNANDSVKEIAKEIVKEIVMIVIEIMRKTRRIPIHHQDNGFVVSVRF